MGDTLWAEDYVASHGVDDLIADKEARTTFHNDKDLIIGMNMQVRSFSNSVIAVSENRGRGA